MRSSVTLIEDLVYGDTGKGKLASYLSTPERCDVSVKALGGANAGNVVMKGTRKIALHLLPAGCIHEDTELFLGRGMVTHLPSLMKELAEVDETFQTKPGERLHIAAENHILFEAHKMADGILEERKEENAVGTTKSGIGPAYADKVLRVGMRFGDLLKDAASVKDRYRQLLEHWRRTYGIQRNSEDEGREERTLLAAKERLSANIVPTTQYWKAHFARGVRVVIAGSQGSALSIDDEGYPYVTASATTTNGHLQGAGIPHDKLTNTIGVIKAYDTRVGNGPFPTEMDSETGLRIATKGHEFGSTTGRPRRVGWLDIERIRDRAWAESVTQLAVLKGDVFDGEQEVRFAVGGSDGQPKYKYYQGWTGLHDVRDEYCIPSNAHHFYEAIQVNVGKKISYIGTGPESEQLIDLT
jgi:adenylosuccinate synthase